MTPSFQTSIPGSYNPNQLTATSNSNSGSVINYINSLSPTSQGSLPQIAQSGLGLFGETLQNVSSQFNSSYQNATAGYAPFPGNTSKIDQLQALYNTVPSQYNVSGTVGAMEQSRKANLLTGQQASNTAAAQMQNSQPGVNNAAASTVLRAQSLMPFLQQSQSAVASEGQYADTARQNALTAASGIANQLATLQQNYTDSLAAYNSQRANFGLNYATAQTGNTLALNNQNLQAMLGASTTEAQLSEQARQANLQAALQVRQQNSNPPPAVAASAPTQPQYGMGYVTNNLGQTVPSSQYNFNI